MVVGDVEPVAIEGHQIIGADQVLGVDDRPDRPQAHRGERLAHHVEDLDDVIRRRPVADDQQPARARRAAVQAAPARMERNAQRCLLRQQALRQRFAVQVEREDRAARHFVGTQPLPRRRQSLLRGDERDAGGVVDHDVFRPRNLHPSTNDYLHRGRRESCIPCHVALLLSRLNLPANRAGAAPWSSAKSNEEGRTTWLYPKRGIQKYRVR